MKAVVVGAFGPADQLAVVERPDPEPRHGQVVIAVEAAGVGLVDILQRRGEFGFSEPGFIPGVEVAGRVQKVGEGVDRGLIGQRVFAQGSGGYAEQFVADAAGLVALPDHLSARNAVALGVNALVAHFSLRRAQVRPGEHVLVRGASGGIGLLAVKMALQLGATVTAVTRSTAADRLAELGIQNIVRRDRETEPAGPFDAVIDPVGGAAVPALLGRLAPNGRYVLNGGAAGFPPPEFGMALVQTFFNSLTFSTFSLNSVPAGEAGAAARAIFADAVRGALVPVVGPVFRLTEAAKAHLALEGGDAFGKIVLEP
ncbi:zinc-binding dehydrogenase [Archangium violaceum]|uniref:quinone oxidoreductase family protein n=1 Tax=Archangium violaceum TaxID=83451 RepID=UPI002B30A3B1|nr:zinc-binding dehydrogenase [Archangium violaceum]